MSPMQRAKSVESMQRGVVAAPKAREDTDTPAPAPSEVVPSPRPPKPIRVTLDLDEARHAFLKAFGSGVSSAQVLRALLDELQANTDLQTNIKSRIWAEKK